MVLEGCFRKFNVKGVSNVLASLISKKRLVLCRDFELFFIDGFHQIKNKSCRYVFRLKSQGELVGVSESHFETKNS